MERGRDSSNGRDTGGRQSVGRTSQDSQRNSRGSRSRSSNRKKSTKNGGANNGQRSGKHRDTDDRRPANRGCLFACFGPQRSRSPSGDRPGQVPHSTARHPPPPASNAASASITTSHATSRVNLGSQQVSQTDQTYSYPPLPSVIRLGHESIPPLHPSEPPCHDNHHRTNPSSPDGHPQSTAEYSNTSTAAAHLILEGHGPPAGRIQLGVLQSTASAPARSLLPTQHRLARRVSVTDAEDQEGEGREYLASLARASGRRNSADGEVSTERISSSRTSAAALRDTPTEVQLVPFPANKQQPPQQALQGALPLLAAANATALPRTLPPLPTPDAARPKGITIRLGKSSPPAATVPTPLPTADAVASLTLGATPLGRQQANGNGPSACDSPPASPVAHPARSAGSVNAMRRSLLAASRVLELDRLPSTSLGSAAGDKLPPPAAAPFDSEGEGEDEFGSLPAAIRLNLRASAEGGFALQPLGPPGPLTAAAAPSASVPSATAKPAVQVTRRSSTVAAELEHMRKSQSAMIGPEPSAAPRFLPSATHPARNTSATSLTKQPSFSLFLKKETYSSDQHADTTSTPSVEVHEGPSYSRPIGAVRVRAAFEAQAKPVVEPWRAEELRVASPRAITAAATAEQPPIEGPSYSRPIGAVRIRAPVALQAAEETRINLSPRAQAPLVDQLDEPNYSKPTGSVRVRPLFAPLPATPSSTAAAKAAAAAAAALPPQWCSLGGVLSRQHGSEAWTSAGSPPTAKGKRVPRSAFTRASRVFPPAASPPPSSAHTTTTPSPGSTVQRAATPTARLKSQDTAADSALQAYTSSRYAGATSPTPTSPPRNGPTTPVVSPTKSSDTPARRRAEVQSSPAAAAPLAFIASPAPVKVIDPLTAARNLLQTMTPSQSPRRQWVRTVTLAHATVDPSAAATPILDDYGGTSTLRLKAPDMLMEMLGQQGAAVPSKRKPSSDPQKPASRSKTGHPGAEALLQQLCTSAACDATCTVTAQPPSACSSPSSDVAVACQDQDCVAILGAGTSEPHAGPTSSSPPAPVHSSPQLLPPPASASRAPLQAQPPAQLGPRHARAQRPDESPPGHHLPDLLLQRLLCVSHAVSLSTDNSPCVTPVKHTPGSSSELRPTEWVQARGLPCPVTVALTVTDQEFSVSSSPDQGNGERESSATTPRGEQGGRDQQWGSSCSSPNTSGAGESPTECCTGRRQGQQEAAVLHTSLSAPFEFPLAGDVCTTPAPSPSRSQASSASHLLRGSAHCHTEVACAAEAVRSAVCGVAESGTGPTAQVAPAEAISEVRISFTGFSNHQSTGVCSSPRVVPAQANPAVAFGPSLTARDAPAEADCTAMCGGTGARECVCTATDEEGSVYFDALGAGNRLSTDTAVSRLSTDAMSYRTAFSVFGADSDPEGISRGGAGSVCGAVSEQGNALHELENLRFSQCSSVMSGEEVSAQSLPCSYCVAGLV
ncbi:MAG: hypothetical protein WDW38_009275 [Sanguina aurantia]